MPARDTDKADAAKADTTFDNGKPDTGAAASDVSTATGTPVSGPAITPPAEPQRVIVEQAPAEPAVYYGEGGQVPGAASATDPNKPHVKADYQPFEW
ncbi:hypothetical protein MKUB_32940 [Mycobacterium kubicae]|uniref:HNH endonuclease n=1 Tax=Mycobacterium kubicae TaxID=120959 RepID=A0AAX1JIF2_9MYCO|nr:hypothetical protein [Mycobacterium kubicae]MCV7095282.1 hypothetical protein [Mycobacterium kubicae]ORV97426.1 hypothetical protein AWC13_16580 [Mycobacterium kubicae]QNI14354.1 hypothetical protein GAN18_27690 [Mycobacterium kubicae]QPI41041.1 hypothetical protein I2456_27150 [Mycobacterium kubicae]GFG65804.1 hypothetical protein MKUB_32940 [Mycobacterium kubicae]